MAEALRVRADVWTLTRDKTWHPTLLWYARAVGKMQERPITDPISWRFQGAIHDYDETTDPLRRSGEPLPSVAVQDQFWRQCQHSTWFFLPWHRIYLYRFEQILRSIIKDLNGPDDWALPYWNYSDPRNPDARRLPDAFREQTLDGGRNPLFVAERRQGLNAGQPAMSDLRPVFADAIVDIRGCLAQPNFPAASGGGAPGFGGAKSGFRHFGPNTAMGAVERTPHGGMHVAIGGGLVPGEGAGWMSSPDTAALDPVFWLHHANIDRLWVVWHADSAHADPPGADWNTAVPFTFNVNGQPTPTAPAEVLNTRNAPLSYRYEDESNPLAPPPPPGRARREPETVPMETEPVAEMVGATDTGVELRGAPARTRLRLNEPTGPARARMAAGRPQRVYLNVENITGRDPHVYAVYVNLPPNADPAEHDELLAGILPMFGIKQQSEAASEHGGSGLHYALDITDLVARLRERGAWDPNTVEFAFLPLAEPRTRAAVAPVHVGRVSVYVA
jgi:tyrosinase